MPAMYRATIRINEVIDIVVRTFLAVYRRAA
jgi:hypothetical protein